MLADKFYCHALIRWRASIACTKLGRFLHSKNKFLTHTRPFPNWFFGWPILIIHLLLLASCAMVWRVGPSINKENNFKVQDKVTTLSAKLPSGPTKKRDNRFRRELDQFKQFKRFVSNGWRLAERSPKAFARSTIEEVLNWAQKPGPC